MISPKKKEGRGMEMSGAWQDKKVLFVGDSLTAHRAYPETVRQILGIEPFYHCMGGVGFAAWY